MKTFFISLESRREFDLSKIISEIDKLKEKKFSLCYSNQYSSFADKLLKKISSKIIFKIQVLGCSNPKFPKGTEAVLFIGEGKFHSVSLAYESKLPVYVVEEKGIRKVKEEEVEKLEKRERGALLRYLNANSVGILVSTKPGQLRIEKAIEFKKNLKNKKSYLFIGNNLDKGEFENFGLDFWVNTACPRIDLTDLPIINLNKLNPRDREN